jgi:hypothetical protein
VNFKYFVVVCCGIIVLMRRKFCGKHCYAHQHSVFCDFHSLPDKEVMGPLKLVYMVSQEGIHVPSESLPKAVDCVLISGYFETSYFKCC